MGLAWGDCKGKEHLNSIHMTLEQAQELLEPYRLKMEQGHKFSLHPRLDLVFQYTKGGMEIVGIHWRREPVAFWNIIPWIDVSLAGYRLFVEALDELSYGDPTAMNDWIRFKK